MEEEAVGRGRGRRYESRGRKKNSNLHDRGVRNEEEDDFIYFKPD